MTGIPIDVLAYRGPRPAMRTQDVVQAYNMRQPRAPVQSVPGLGARRGLVACVALRLSPAMYRPSARSVSRDRFQPLA
jgi:hypothetical protein